MNILVIILAIVGGLFLLLLILAMLFGDDQKIRDMSKVELTEDISGDEINDFKIQLKQELQEAKEGAGKLKRNNWIIYALYILAWVIMAGSIASFFYDLIPRLGHKLEVSTMLLQLLLVVFGLAVIKLAGMLIRRNRYIRKLERIMEKE